MLLRFRCGACARPMRAREELAGKRVKCPGCGSAQEVPPRSSVATAAAGEADPVAAVTPSARHGRRPATGAEARRAVWPWLVCAALGALLAAALPLALFGHLRARSARNELEQARASLAAAEQQAAEVQDQLAEARNRLRESEARAERTLARLAEAQKRAEKPGDRAQAPPPKPTPPERALPEPPAPREVPGDAEVERAAQTLLSALNEGRLAAVWDALPVTYQKDLNDLVHDFAGRVDPQVWAQLMAVLKNSGTLLEQRPEDVAGLFGTEWGPEVGRNLPGVGEALRNAAESDLADLDRLKKADLGAMLKRLPATFARKRPDLDVRVRVVSRQGNRAAVRVEVPEAAAGTFLAGLGGEDIQLVRVQGKWVPRELVDRWSAGMTAARHSVAALGEETSGPSKKPLLALLGAVDETAKKLLAAKGKEEFQAAFRAGMESVVRRGQALDTGRLVSRLDLGEFGEKSRREGGSVEDEVRRYRDRPGSVLVVEDTGGKYWAFPVSGVEQVRGRALTLRRGTTVATGGSEGDRTREQIVGDFAGMVQRPGGGGYFVQLGAAGGKPTASGIVGAAKEDITVQVKTVLGGRDAQ